MLIYSVSISVMIAKFSRMSTLFLFPIVLFIQADAQAENIQKILDERVRKNYNVGIIIAIVTPDHTDYYQAGKLNNNPNSPPIDADTLFPLASITKVFTTLAFANQVIQGRVALNTEAQPYMPKPMTLPKWHGQAIRLVDLATYTAGMSPALPFRAGVTWALNVKVILARCRRGKTGIVVILRRSRVLNLFKHNVIYLIPHSIKFLHPVNLVGALCFGIYLRDGMVYFNLQLFQKGKVLKILHS